MKTIKSTATKMMVAFLSLFFSFVTLAQEKKAEINVDINKDGGGGNWYTNPVVWIVGAAVFILLLVALLRGNSSKE